MATPVLLSVWVTITVGVGAIIRGLWLIVRAIVHLVESTEANTRAVGTLTATVAALSGRVDTIEKLGGGANAPRP